MYPTGIILRRKRKMIKKRQLIFVHAYILMKIYELFILNRKFYLITLTRKKFNQKKSSDKLTKCCLKMIIVKMIIVKMTKCSGFRQFTEYFCLNEKNIRTITNILNWNQFRIKTNEMIITA